MVTQGVNAEADVTNSITSYNTDGFTLGDWGHVNYSGVTYVGWQWKLNGGTTSANTDGALNSTVQVNATAGISLVTFTADGTTTTVGHGLGSAPDVVMVKSRNVAGGWLLMTHVLDGGMDYAYMNLSLIHISEPTRPY